jgi:hypothetical protein
MTAVLRMVPELSRLCHGQYGPQPSDYEHMFAIGSPS